MVLRLLSIVVLSTLFLLRPGSALAEESRSADATSAADVQSRELLERKLATIKGAERGQVIPVADAVLTRVFGGDVFYALRFQHDPVAVMPPDPLGANNLFVVRADRSVQHLADADALEAFFRAMLRPVTFKAGTLVA